MLSEISEAKSLSTTEPLTPGILFVVSSPSGGGKGTLIQLVLKRIRGVSYSISYTTRNPRAGEIDGREYFFVQTETFEEMIKRDEFLEWARVHGKLYGTARDQVSRELNEGRDIILEVDVQGAASVRRLIPDSVSIFILPPSQELLRARLTARGTDTDEELELRLRNAPDELKDHSAFDYVIINDDAEHAATQLEAVIVAERVRFSRQEAKIRRVVDTFAEIDNN
jgi:guanylate kinase